MHHFLCTQGSKQLVRLHKTLYRKEILQRAKELEPGTVGAVQSDGQYYLVELSVDTEEDYFSFLNYLIYLGRHH
ncbi:MAG: hypothetical protein WCI77_01695 [Candidatus Omnitrophota bacterium]